MLLIFARTSMGYWESLDREHIEQRRKLPWYKRDYFWYAVVFVCALGSMYLIVFLIKAAVRFFSSFL